MDIDIIKYLLQYKMKNNTQIDDMYDYNKFKDSWDLSPFYESYPYSRIYCLAEYFKNFCTKYFNNLL